MDNWDIALCIVMFQLLSGLLKTFISLLLPEFYYLSAFINTSEFGLHFLEKQKQMCCRVQTSLSVQDSWMN